MVKDNDKLTDVLNETCVDMVTCIRNHINDLDNNEMFQFGIEIAGWLLAYTAHTLIKDDSPSAVKYELIDDIKDIAKSILEVFIERHEKMVIKQKE
jgi:hypothetical protein